MKFPRVRTINFIAFSLCILLLLVSFYFQFVKDMQPCMLCILQRCALMVLGILFLIAAIHNPKKVGIQIYAVLSFLVAIVGVIFATRQAWIQHQPPSDQETCLPSLNFLIQTKPLPEVFNIMFHGGSDCAAVTWRCIGFSMAEWTLIFFVFFAVIAILLFVLPKNDK